jgi:hypothetical protein
MKSIATIAQQALTKQPELKTESHHNIPDELKEVARYVFGTLTATRPGWKVGFTNAGRVDEKMVTQYKMNLLKAMMLNEINTMQKVQYGLDKLISEGGQFLPSVGDFVQACKDHSKVTGELNAGMYKEYRPERLISNKTFEERRAEAKSELAKIKEMLCKSKT